ncbi:MAG: rRNA maturation RNase YbeY [Thermomicrobiales bacterium]|nr:rRNA maturation RNase YbeY [Thermomicrobiales bacterium]
MVEVDITAEVALPAGSDCESLPAMIEYVLYAESQTGTWNVAVALVSDGAMRRLHREFMGLDTNTDVMTFPRESEPWDPTQGGDIAISVDRAIDQAPEFGLTGWDEVRFLVVHGLLHLCGWVDANDDDRAQMLTRQRELIDRFDRRTEH